MVMGIQSPPARALDCDVEAIPIHAIRTCVAFVATPNWAQTHVAE